MYIRWKKRATSKRHRPTGYHTLSAYLVSSHRVGGQPRQKAMYLACICDRLIPIALHRRLFWKAVREKLEGLTLSPQERTDIESKLAQTVPEPTHEQVEDDLAQLRRLEGL